MPKHEENEKKKRKTRLTIKRLMDSSEKKNEFEVVLVWPG